MPPDNFLTAILYLLIRLYEEMKQMIHQLNTFRYIHYLIITYLCSALNTISYEKNR